MDKKPSRKLAAILFADIVGYTALMGRDEIHARQLVQKFRQILTTEVSKSNGQIIQFYGDGCLCIFDSSVNAADCALKLQTAFLNEPIVPVRIGLHCGDVYVEEDGVYGDSVNLTSRIESMGIPGAILFSERIKKDIQNQQDFIPVSLGQFIFKNVDVPMEVYALGNKGLPIPSKEEIKGKGKGKVINSSQPGSRISSKYLGIILIALIIILSAGWLWNHYSPIQPEQKANNLSSKKTIAVLSFLDLSPQGDQTYFSEGIAEEILIHLSNVKDLNVIARTSSFSYKGKNIPIKVIGQELGADFILEGSVRKENETVGISVRMINAFDESEIWQNTFERELGNTMEIQRDIAKAISQKLNPNIPTIKLNRSITQSTKNFKAFDLYLKAKFENRKGRLIESNDFLEDCLVLDSTFAEAYSLMAWNYLLLGINWNEYNQEHAYKKASASIQKSLELDAENSESHLIFAAIKLFLEWDFAGTESQIEEAFGINQWPESPTSFCFCTYVHLLISSGRLEEASGLLTSIRQIDPNYAYLYSDLGLIHLFQNQWSEAETHLVNGLSHHKSDYLYRLLGLVYILQGKYEKAIETANESILSFGRDPRTIAYLAIAYFHSGKQHDYRQILEELQKRSSEKEKRTQYALALLYAGIGEDQKALDWLELAYLEKEIELIWLNVEPVFQPLHMQVRFKSLLSKVGIK